MITYVAMDHYNNGESYEELYEYDQVIGVFETLQKAIDGIGKYVDEVLNDDTDRKFIEVPLNNKRSKQFGENSELVSKVAYSEEIREDFLSGYGNKAYHIFYVLREELR